MQSPWRYSATVKANTDTPARLAMRASAAVPASPDVVLDSSTLALRCSITVDGEPLDASLLIGSVSARYIFDWLRDHRRSLAIDRVDHPRPSACDVIFALHAYTQSPRALSVSQPDAFPTEKNCADADSPKRLTELSLTLAFQSTGTPAAAAQPEGDGTAVDGTGTEPRVPGNTAANALASLLSAPATDSSALHFTVAPMLHAALSRLCKRLVSAFPLCFNSRWLARLQNDRTSHSSIGASLSSILDLHHSALSREDARQVGTTCDPRIAQEAALLHLSLRVRYEAGRNSGGTEERLEETTDDLPLDVKEAISAAILRIGKSAASPDPWLDAVDGSVSGPAHVARQQ